MPRQNRMARLSSSSSTRTRAGTADFVAPGSCAPRALEASPRHTTRGSTAAPSSPTSICRPARRGARRAGPLPRRAAGLRPGQPRYPRAPAHRVHRLPLPHTHDEINLLNQRVTGTTSVSFAPGERFCVEGTWTCDAVDRWERAIFELRHDALTDEAAVVWTVAGVAVVPGQPVEFYERVQVSDPKGAGPTGTKLVLLKASIETLADGTRLVLENRPRTRPSQSRWGLWRRTPWCAPPRPGPSPSAAAIMSSCPSSTGAGARALANVFGSA